MSRRLCALLLAVLGSASVPEGATAEPARAAPQIVAGENEAAAEVYRLVETFRGEIDLVRREIGRPEVARAILHVEHAAPREVLSQARSLFRKADRLCFEYTRSRHEVPPTPTGTIRLADVSHVLTAALRRLECVKAELGIEEQSPAPAQDASGQPSRVFGAIHRASRQLNALLTQPVTPGEVFARVTLALSYATRLRERFSHPAMPPAPPFERFKRPLDVYGRLLECFEIVARISRNSGLEVLAIGPAPDEKVVPSDVYDLASLIVSELHFLQGLADPGDAPYAISYVGRKTPSEVYQRVGVLEAQLLDLDRRVAHEPDWLPH